MESARKRAHSAPPGNGGSLQLAFYNSRNGHSSTRRGNTPSDHERNPGSRRPLEKRLTICVSRGGAGLFALPGEFIMRQKLLIIAVLAAGLATRTTFAQEPAKNEGAKAIIGTVERL